MAGGEPAGQAALPEEGKEVKAYRIGGVRPLQLTTINKRHLGSYWAERVGPAVEPALPPHRAAIH
eukprot:8046253-Lingulodinium_polyedra.AAC.1